MTFYLSETDKELLQRVLDKERTSPPPALSREPVFEPQMSPEVYVVKPIGTAEVPGRTGTSPGEADAAVFKFEQSGSGDWSLTPVTYPDNEPKTVRVFNINTAALPNTYLETKRDKYGRWIVGSGAGGGSGVIVKFITTTAMSNSVASAYLHGGDSEETFVVHDIQNQWPEVQIKAVGWAQLRGERYEILNVSLPIDRVLVTFEECMKGNDPTYTAFIRPSDVPGIISSFPHVDVPAEWSPVIPQPGAYSFSFINPERFTSVAGGRGELVRYPKHKKPSDNENIDANVARVALEYEWRLVSVTKPYAKGAYFEKNGGEWTFIKPIDGFDPMQCSGGSEGARPTVICSTLGSCDCLKDGHKVYAVYDVNANEYDIISSASALLGVPEDIPIHRDNLTWDKTTLKYIKQTIKAFPCGNEPVTTPAKLPTRDCYGNSSGGGSGG